MVKCLPREGQTRGSSPKTLPVPGVMRSVLDVVGPESVMCDWVRQF